jgi:hypothetical protein
MKRVVIVGVGALGSHVLLFARNWDVELCIVDFDKVESKNIQSQFHTELGKGRNKAKALQLAMQGMYRRSIDALPVKLEEGNVGSVLDNASLIIDCTDNAATRQLIQVHAGASIPCLHGCLSADGTLARAVWTEHFNVDSGGAGAATCEDGQNLPFHAMAAGMIAFAAQWYLDKGVRQSWMLTPSSLVRIA